MFVVQSAPQSLIAVQTWPIRALGSMVHLDILYYYSYVNVCETYTFMWSHKWGLDTEDDNPAS